MCIARLQIYNAIGLDNTSWVNKFQGGAALCCHSIDHWKQQFYMKNRGFLNFRNRNDSIHFLCILTFPILTYGGSVSTIRKVLIFHTGIIGMHNWQWLNSWKKGMTTEFVSYITSHNIKGGILSFSSQMAEWLLIEVGTFRDL